MIPAKARKLPVQKSSESHSISFQSVFHFIVLAPVILGVFAGCGNPSIQSSQETAQENNTQAKVNSQGASLKQTTQAKRSNSQGDSDSGAVQGLRHSTEDVGLNISGDATKSVVADCSKREYSEKVKTENLGKEVSSKGSDDSSVTDPCKASQANR